MRWSGRTWMENPPDFAGRFGAAVEQMPVVVYQPPGSQGESVFLIRGEGKHQLALGPYAPARISRMPSGSS